jgi:hypothetical protein
VTRAKTEPDYDPMKVPGPWLMKCPSCTETMWASEEDPDAAQGDMFNHIFWDHADRNRESAHALLAKVRVIQHG